MTSPLPIHRALLALSLVATLGCLAAACGSETAEPTSGDDTEAESGAQPSTLPDDDTEGDEPAPGDDTAAAADTPVPLLPVDVTEPESWQTDPLRAPFSIHLTYQQDPASALTFQWATMDIDTSAYTPRVWIVPASEVEVDGAPGPIQWAEAWVHEGTGLLYRETLLGIELNEIDFVKWTVEVTGLEPYTEYYYRLGTYEDFDPATGTFTDPDLTHPLKIRTGRVKGSRAPFDVVLAGDSRGGNAPIMENMDVFLSTPADLWFFNGDMSQGGTQVEWDEWFAAMAPIMTLKPMMTVQGNHEILAGLYYDQIALPLEPLLPADLIEHGWSFTYGNVHFVGLDSNSDDAVERQVEWLNADLAAARQDPDIDFIVAMMHHAPYSASNHGSTQRLINHWVPLFEEHLVDLVFSGHDHNYERSHSVRAGQVVDEAIGVRYVVAGAFFAPAYSNGNEWWTATSTHGDKANFVNMHVEGDTMSLVAYSGDGTEILDQLTVKKRP